MSITFHSFSPVSPRFGMMKVDKGGGPPGDDPNRNRKNLKSGHYTDYTGKIKLNPKNNKIIKKQHKPCSNCKETDKRVKFFSNKVSKIEGIVRNFHKNINEKIKENQGADPSILRIPFTLHGIPCEMEHNLQNVDMTGLQTLVNVVTANTRRTSSADSVNDEPTEINNSNNQSDKSQEGKGKEKEPPDRRFNRQG